MTSEDQDPDAIVARAMAGVSNDDHRALFARASAAQEVYRQVVSQLGAIRARATQGVHAELGSPGAVGAELELSTSRVVRLLNQAVEHGRDDRSGGWAMVVYRNTRPDKIELDGRRAGETDGGESGRRAADSGWWTISPKKRSELRVVVYVVDGTVKRIRAVDPHGAWSTNNINDKCMIPVGPELTTNETRRRFPTLPLRLNEQVERVRGRIRHYLPL